jgi:phenylalanyl-tRNA synthetase alpha chain
MNPEEARRILEEERERGLSMIASADSSEALEAAKVGVLGRKSPFSQVERALGSFGPEDRKRLGMAANDLRDALRAALDDRGRALAGAEQARLLEGDRIDVTLPGRRLRTGSLHPLTIVEDEMVGIFTRMGYRVEEGPEIEDDWHNFEALNIPPDHPARTMQDTLYVDVPGRPDLLLRTHTSPVQVRAMQAQDPPIYVVVPGRTYRRETPDATHGSVFHQVEGLAVDEGISFADLKGTLETFARALFGPDRRVRMNPDYFPFVEPGCQVAVSCFKCDGTGCAVCGNGWIELLGAGMVHPKVLENCGIDAERYTGFAFGIGVERVAMVRHGVSDMRIFVEGDVRFLQQFQGAGV